MGLGPNYVLNKGHLATGGSVAYQAGRFVVATGDGTKCAKAAAAGVRVRGVCMEDVDADKVATGKVVVNVAMLGIVRVVSGAAVAVDASVTTDNQGRAVTTAVGNTQAGVAMTAATEAGQSIDVLLTPAGTVPSA
jgi:hypothetical protein